MYGHIYGRETAVNLNDFAAIACVFCSRREPVAAGMHSATAEDATVSVTDAAATNCSSMYSIATVHSALAEDDKVSVTAVAAELCVLRGPVLASVLYQ